MTFGSKIKVLDRKFKFLKFSKGWINKNDVKPISYREIDPFKKISIYKIKYKIQMGARDKSFLKKGIFWKGPVARLLCVNTNIFKF